MPRTREGAQFTHDSVQRALVQHQIAGRIRDWSPPERSPHANVRGRYRVDLYDYGTWTGSLRETYALVVGLRVTEVHAQQSDQARKEHA